MTPFSCLLSCWQRVRTNLAWILPVGAVFLVLPFLALLLIVLNSH